MESETTHTTPTPDSNRELAELEERQSWAHHVADAATGELLTTQLTQPVTPLSRLERLSRLGHQFDPSILGAPTHRLTPRHPYQVSPRGTLEFHRATTFTVVESVLSGDEGHVKWDLRDLGRDKVGSMTALLFGTPQGRCLLTLQLATHKTPGEEVGRIDIKVWRSEGVIASLGLAVHVDHFYRHTVDLVFSWPEPTYPSRVTMVTELGGLSSVWFHSLTLAPAPPLDLHP